MEIYRGNFFKVNINDTEEYCMTAQSYGHGNKLLLICVQGYNSGCIIRVFESASDTEPKCVDYSEIVDELIAYFECSKDEINFLGEKLIG